jgi:hypothetical protein
LEQAAFGHFSVVLAAVLALLDDADNGPTETTKPER